MLIKMVGLVCLLSATTHAKNITSKFNIQTKLGEVSFAFHGNEKNIELAKNLSAVAKKDIPKIVDYFRYKPEDIINVNIVDSETSSNGTAQTFPRNQIKLYTMQPLGQNYLTSSVDFYKKLFIHEFIHIIHMEQTNGYIDTAESVFGSIAKLLPAVVPRWFSEGIAMWGEDHFTNEGRMKNPFLLNDVSNYFLNKKECQNISCLDDPGTYPHGSLSYWAGGFFMKYLEGLRSGNIACLVNSNSSAIPFFLNDAFIACTGDRAQVHFDMFRSKLIKKKTFDFLYQKGIHFTGEYPVYFKEVDRKVFLSGNGTNIDLKKAVVSIQPSLDDLTYIAVDSLGSKQHYQTYKVTKDGSSKLISEGPQYFFELNGESWSFEFLKNHWQINKNKEKAISLPKFDTLVNPYAYEGEVYFSTYGLSEGYQIKKINRAESKIDTIVNLKDTFNYIGLCEGEGAFYKTKTGYLQVDKSKVSFLDLKEGSPISYIAGRNGKTLALRSDLEKRDGKCRDLFKVSKDSPVGQYPKYEKSASIDEDYSAFKHLAPNHWFFLASTTEDNLSFWRVFTTINDPLDKHTFILNGDYYSELESWGGLLDYTYAAKYFDINLSYLKEFQKNTINPSVRSFEEGQTLSLVKSKEWGLLETRVAAFYGMTKSRGVFSSEETDQYGVNFTIFKNAKYKYQFFKNMTLYTAVSNNSTSKIDDYKRYRALGSFRFDLYKNSIFEVRSTYEKLDKTTLNGGVIYGGGNLRSIHQIYGLDYSDAFGNEMETLRFKFNIEVFRPYKGWGFVPYYLKRINLITGVDYLKTDYIFFNNSLYRDRSVTSKYVGVSIDSQVFYHLPLTIEIVSSDVAMEDNGSKSALDIFVQGGYAF